MIIKQNQKQAKMDKKLIDEFINGLTDGNKEILTRFKLSSYVFIKGKLPCDKCLECDGKFHVIPLCAVGHGDVVHLNGDVEKVFLY